MQRDGVGVLAEEEGREEEGASPSRDGLPIALPPC